MVLSGAKISAHFVPSAVVTVPLKRKVSMGKLSNASLTRSISGFRPSVILSIISRVSCNTLASEITNGSRKFCAVYSKF